MIYILPALLLLSACSITQVYRDGELESRSWSLGPPPQPEVGEETVIISTHKLGLAVGLSGVLVGWDHDRRIYPARDCIAIVVVGDEAQLARIEEKFGPIEQVCVTKGEGP